MPACGIKATKRKLEGKEEKQEIQVILTLVLA
jgi:hypothetical protein